MLYEQENDSSLPNNTHLERTIKVKDSTIEQLIRELQQTKQLYARYKSTHLAELEKLQGTIAELHTRNEAHKMETDNLRRINQRLSAEVQQLLEREARSNLQFKEHVAALNENMTRIKGSHSSAQQENSVLREKLDIQQSAWKQANLRWAECQKQRNRVEKEKEELVRELQRKDKEHGEWQKEVADTLESLERRNESRCQKGARLAQMEGRISKILQGL